MAASVLWTLESQITQHRLTYNAPLSRFGLLPGLGANENLQWHWCLQGAFSLEKTRNLGAVGRITCKFTVTLNPKRVWPEETQGIWKGWCNACFPWKKIRSPGAVGRVTHTFPVALNARRILPQQTQGFWGVGTTRFFLVKYKEFGGGRSLDIEICSQNEPEVQFIYVYMVYTTILRGRWRVGGRGAY